MGDLLLAVFAIVVVVACVLVIQRADDPVPVSALTQGQSSPVSPTPSPSLTVKVTPRTTPSPDANEEPATVVVAGPDVAKLGADLVSATGDTVLVAKSNGQQVLAAGALEAIDQVPAAVVLQVVAGSKTSARTTAAVAAVRKRWPEVTIVVIGPFGADDRKSAAAVKAAAESAHVRFLDPVALGWRKDAAKAVVAEADYPAVAAKIAAALT